MSVDQVAMRLEVLKGETLGKLRSHFQKKVQFEELVEENEVLLHYTRGFLDGLDKAVGEIAEIKKGAELENLRISILERKRQFNVDSGDGSCSLDATLITQNVEIKNL